MGILEELEKEAPKIDAYMEKIIPKDKWSEPVTEPIWELLNRGGKRFRPVMCILSCKAVGGREKHALHTASIIELFHNFTLIHDDIEDDSEMRRGKPCLHKIYGVPVAINSGDGLLLYTLRALEEVDEKVRLVLYNSFIRVLNGQGIELEWNTKKTQIVNEGDYLRMVGMKTGALISAACEVGGLLGGGTQKQTEALRHYGMAVGVAFQIQDDLLNIFGQEKLYKKEIGGDISEGKRTLMTIRALNIAKKEESEELLGILNSRTQDQKKIGRAIEIIENSGSADYAKKKARDIVRNAKEMLRVLPDNESTERLNRLADFLIEREF